MATTYGNTFVTPDTWDGDYPLEDLPKGGLWKGSYGGAYQCIGFAKMVLDATYGAGTTFAAKSPFEDATDVRRQFGTIAIGDRVTFELRNKAYGEQHGIIVANKSSAGIQFYDCNRVGSDKIGFEMLT